MRHLFVSLVLWMHCFGAVAADELPGCHAGGSTFRRLLHLFVVSGKRGRTLSGFREGMHRESTIAVDGAALKAL
jgi:hypothetical protein